MSKLEYAESFRDLVVYKNARKIAKSIFEITKSFPKEEISIKRTFFVISVFQSVMTDDWFVPTL